MRRIRGRLVRLEQRPELQPKCTCPFPLTHYKQRDGTMIPPFVPCLHPSGACPVVQSGQRAAAGPPDHHSGGAKHEDYLPANAIRISCGSLTSRAAGSWPTGGSNSADVEFA